MAQDGNIVQQREVPMKTSDKIVHLTVFAAFSYMAPATHADGLLKPYLLASNKPGDMAAILQQTQDALAAHGFEVVGEYSPYNNAEVLIVTNTKQKAAAAKTTMGGYGATDRVALTKVNGNIQVAYTNPLYMANAFRMADDLSDVGADLAAALGAGRPFGAGGLSAADLREYHYKFMMPYFDEPYELGRFASYDEAVKAVEAGMASGRGGVSKVYRVDIPGKKQTVFGVHMTEGCSGDQYIMDRIDFAETKSTPHLPYEVLVSGNNVYALAAKFRIAQSFPDLSMVGSNSFLSIMCAPDAIETALKTMLGNR